MTNQLQFRTGVPVGFIAVCGVAFFAGLAATIYFCRSMCCEMEMPGGWTMSMMWIRMPGHTWLTSAASFLLMWLAMKVAMMLPSATKTFLNTKRTPTSLFVIAGGYFAVWLAVGAGIYLVGIVFAAAAMQWKSFSQTVPVLSGAALMIAGAIQFTRWKMGRLLRCRSLFGCGSSCPEHETGFRLGCKQGAACCLCCAAPTMILLVLGMMNPWVIVGVAIIIAAEKLLPWPEMVTRFVGVAALAAGASIIVQKLSV